MDTRTIKKIVRKVSPLLAGVLIAFFVVAPMASAIVNYPASASLGTGSVRGSHILDGTLTNADISATAGITGGKITVGGTTGAVMLTDGTNMATTTSLKFATSTKDLYVLTGRIHASSTNLNGVNQTWPSADGAASTYLTTNGSGTLSWGSIALTTFDITATAGEALTAGAPVTISSATTSLWSTNFATTRSADGAFGTASVQTMAQSFTGVSGEICGVSLLLLKNSSPTDTVTVTIETDSAGDPSGTALATATFYPAELTSSAVWYSRQLDNCVYLTPASTYWYAMRRTGAMDAVNNYSYSYASGDTYVSGLQRYWNGVAWAAETPGRDQVASTSMMLSAGKAYRTTAKNATSANNYIGVAKQAYATGTTATVHIGGLPSVFTGLTWPSAKYAGNATGTISDTAGANSVQVGRSVSATSIMMSQ